ncbi:MAG: hypothetical protein D3922_02260 [Candidatus Electrothrix sp. AR1]|nr:hypothetical protein [Candidatus Electrothrix sp. AR1]
MNYYLVIGNGVSIDLIKFLKKDDSIDLSNLFNNGERVRWPVGNHIGFLSYKYCPALWRLGARPTSNVDEAHKIINDIITCANVYASLSVKNRPKMANDIESIYLKSYNELVSYLRFLFVHYNTSVDDKMLDDVCNWQWAKIIKKMYDDKNVNKINIITYNYDVWIERVLDKLKLEYNVFMGEKGDSKIEIYKPHGSISFIHDTVMSLDAFELKNSFEHTDAEINKFKVVYEDLICNPAVIPLIPPAGQSSRYQNSWAASIRNGIVEECQKSTNSDVLIFGGLSYWHVDREEIDEIILNINNKLNMFLVNPNPPKEFFAVLTTIFKNAVHLTSDQDSLGGII